MGETSVSKEEEISTIEKEEGEKMYKLSILGHKSRKMITTAAA